MDQPTQAAARRSRWLGDLLASLVVFLVALPLSLGIAVASGAPIRAGLVAAIVGGIVVGLAGGAPLQVSGPAAGLSVIVYGLIQQLGLPGACAVVVIGGGFQVLAGLAGVARAAMAISPAVLQGMLGGIGVVIALGQIQVLFGSSPQPSALLNLVHLPEAFSNADRSAMIVGFSTLALLWAWDRFLAKRVRLVPGSLFAIAIGTGIGAWLPQAPPLIEVPPDLLTRFDWPDFGAAEVQTLVSAALALAFIASAESLLCAVATDQLHGGPRANLNRELWAQGLGNITSGCFGGLPVTGVIVRSTANISSGAQTRLSAVLHGVWMLVLVTAFASFLGLIPRAVLAALLVMVGLKLVKPKEIVRLARFNEAILYAVTILGVVFIDLLWGVGLGIGLALLMLLRRITQVELKSREVGEQLEVTIRGSLSFLAVPMLMNQLESLPPRRRLRLSFDVDHLDHAAIEAIRGWRLGYERAGGEVTKQPLDALWGELAAGRREAHAASARGGSQAPGAEASPRADERRR
jgi:carbonic anhydrase